MDIVFLQVTFMLLSKVTTLQFLMVLEHTCPGTAHLREVRSGLAVPIPCGGIC